MAVVECRKCHSLLDDGETTCPQCGSSDSMRPGEDAQHALAVRKELNTFVMSNRFNGIDRNNAVAIDETNNRIALIFDRSTSMLDKKKIIQANEILDASVEVVRGNATTETDSGSQIGRMLIGGLMLGGVGAVIGGLSASKTTSQSINRIDLVICTKASGWPSHRINLLLGEYPEASNQVRSVIDAGTAWALKIKAMRDEASYRHSPSSLADELGKLVWLREHGEISQSEFEQLKRKLMG